MGWNLFFRRPKVEEKRKYVRVSSYNPVKIIKDGDRRPHCLVNIVDISEGGMKFRSEKEFARGSVLTAILHIAEQERQVSLRAEVMWMQQIKKQSMYHVGVRFVELGDKERAILREWITSAKG